MVVPLAIVWNDMGMVPDGGAELVDRFLQLRKLGIGLFKVVDEGRNIVDFVEGLLYIAVPQ